MSKKCVCGNEMFTVFMCRKCEHLLYVEEDEDFLRSSEKSPQNPVPVAANRKKVCGDFSAERKGSREPCSRRKAMKTEKKNLRRISIVVTAQTKGNLERLAAVCGYSEIGRVVDKLTREKMISLHDFERKEKHYE